MSGFGGDLWFFKANVAVVKFINIQVFHYAILNKKINQVLLFNFSYFLNIKSKLLHIKQGPYHSSRICPDHNFSIRIVFKNRYEFINFTLSS